MPLCSISIAQDNALNEALPKDANFIIQDDIIVTSANGISLSVLVVRPNIQIHPLPVALNHTIYANKNRAKDISKAMRAAKRGYIGVISYSRGKHLSKDRIVPYEKEVEDVNTIIEWVSKQSWSDGRVAMYGGSYDGFSQWAATKNLHPALKTIVPYVAAIPGQGLPMENNVFLNANYGWPFHVTNNRYKDNSIYTNPKRWSDLNTQWYKSGRSYRDIDKLDVEKNPWLQRWLTHPSYDSYWQDMVPFKADFKRINIPVLSITGYYDDGQISALHYLNEHFRYVPDPDHYLIIGPYDHWTAQTQAEDELRGVKLDSVAHINTPDITFEWFDYILKNGMKPTLIKNRINYQVMGDNSWKHASSMKDLNSQTESFYLSTNQLEGVNLLSRQQPTSEGFSKQKVDLQDRSKGNTYYPWPIVSDSSALEGGIIFMSELLDVDKIIAGQFSAELKVIINKQDFDLSIVLYEQKPDGSLFHLSYFVGRASYAKDMTKRHLLQPEAIESIPISRTRMIGKRINKGSRLVVKVNVNKNDFAQVNYGTGKDVSDETIEDAKEPLEVKWLNSSKIMLPIQNM